MAGYHENMPATQYSNEDVVRLGQERYQRDIRARVEPLHLDKFLALDIETGEYEIGEQVLDAVRALRTKRPQAVVHIHRIGHPAVYRLGSAFRPAKS